MGNGQGDSIEILHGNRSEVRLVYTPTFNENAVETGSIWLVEQDDRVYVDFDAMSLNFSSGISGINVNNATGDVDIRPHQNTDSIVMQDGSGYTVMSIDDEGIKVHDKEGKSSLLTKKDVDVIHHVIDVHNRGEASCQVKTNNWLNPEEGSGTGNGIIFLLLLALILFGVYIVSHYGPIPMDES